MEIPLPGRPLHNGARGGKFALRDGEIERGPFAFGTLGPDATTVPFNNAFDNGQADAGAFFRAGLFVTLKALEDLEDLVEVLLLDA
jgi:hypothetical protein